ncbi:methyltransferase domain-containing protein [Saccharopolyspora sp. K220]|uniref:class I SAM-dependent methyltransferase n=1 Tax=Saccharopolyspora soli TaxID=2926618 RepID=UPI001F579350|nr:class I SAM-dependent methyltransferase [Saccharopolyspora soli]MCI2420238.1 methyltransferase domain-containing protein [Saccharopolyspora soli]
MDEGSARHFYDELAEDYHRIYPDWETSSARQAHALDGLIRREHGPGPQSILDCACGIGTQALGLAALGHRVIGTDISPVAITRAAREARARQLLLPAAAADMRALPFRSASFDVIVCADNALPHLLTPDDLQSALTGMRRLLRPGGLLLITTRLYDSIRKTRPRSTPPQVADTPTGRTITFQLWDWHNDAEHYEIEHFQLIPHAESWSVRVRRTTYWALTQDQLMGFVIGTGFQDAEWHAPEDTGFFQPILTARVPTSHGSGLS